MSIPRDISKGEEDVSLAKLMTCLLLPRRE
jgi:hypothetical protein